MKCIALTGGIGAGKSAAAAEFARLGAEVIDADKISRRIMLPGESAYNKVVAEFGSGILLQDGTINRRALGDIVFSDREKLEKLNSITHSQIYEEIKRGINMSEAEVVCVEIPLLFTTKCPVEFDMKIAVIASPETRIKRTMERDNVTLEQVEARMEKQLSDEELKVLADCVIENDGDIELLRKQVEAIYNSLLK